MSAADVAKSEWGRGSPQVLMTAGYVCGDIGAGEKLIAAIVQT